MSGIFLVSTLNGRRIEVPSNKNTIGRGPFLEVTDKRVSRNHATLEIVDDKLILTPIHTNPCFFKKDDSTEELPLEKDKPVTLEDNQLFSLLPDNFFYRIVYSRQKNESKSEEEEKEADIHDKQDQETKDDLSPSKRSLPKWMQSASKRVPVSDETKAESSNKKVKDMAEEESSSNNVPVKSSPVHKEKTESFEKPKASRGRGRGAPRGARRGGRPRGSVNKRSARKANSDDDDDEEFYPREEKPRKTRAPRAAAAKRPKYTDDDFALSDEDFIPDEDSDDSDQHTLGRRKNSDEDFVAEEDSGSDWEATVSRKSRQQSIDSPKRGRGRGRGRPAGIASRKRPQRQRSRHSTDEDDFSDDFGDSYVPRLSKRRASASQRYKEESSEGDESDKSTPVKKSQSAPAARKQNGRGNRPSRQAPASKKKAPSSSEEEEDDEEDESDEDDDGLKSRRSCMYGTKCFRKNAAHLAEYCHPGDDSFDENEAAVDKEMHLRGKGLAKRTSLSKDKDDRLSKENDEDITNSNHNNDNPLNDDNESKSNSVKDEDIASDNKSEEKPEIKAKS